MGNKTDEKSSSAEFRRLLGSAEFGSASAQRELGERYRAGDCTAEERAEAVKWYQKAARGDDAEIRRKAEDALKSLRR